MPVVVQVQRHLQLRIEAQGKYMQTILEKACQTLSGGDSHVGPAAAAAGPYKLGMANHHPPPHHQPDQLSAMKDFGFPAFQDLNIYGGHDQLDLQQSIDGSSSLDGFLSNNNDNLCLAGRGKKRPSPCHNGGTGKSPLIWSDELGQPVATSCGLGPPQDNDQMIQIAPLSLDRGGNDIVDDSVSEFYETKPSLNMGGAGSGGGEHGPVNIGEVEKKFDPSHERHSPSRRAGLSNERMNPAIVMNMNLQAAQGRNSTFG